VTAATDWAGLAQRVSGELLLPESPRYDGARKAFAARFDDVLPSAVVRCSCVADVVEVIKFTRRYGIEVAIRSGGHSLAGYSSTRGILVDVGLMDRVTVSEGLAEVEAGARLGAMYSQLLAAGVTVPAGTCPSVGIAGLTLGGGFGLLGRAYGLTLDHLVAATVVLSSGRAIECSDDNEPDLFWALRGAGAGQFGVVTSFRFRTQAAPARMTNFILAWQFANAASVLSAWQTWAPLAPDELYAELELSASDNPIEDPTVHVQGASIANGSMVRQWLRELVQTVGSDTTLEQVTELSYQDTIAFHGALSESVEIVNGQSKRRGYGISRSAFFSRPLPLSKIGKLMSIFGDDRKIGQARTLYIAPWGGAINRRPPDATAFCHRDQQFLIEHSASLPPNPPASARSAAQDWVNTSWGTVHGASSGRVYPCFQDPDLGVWDEAYFGENVSRLRALKARYDPDDVFKFS
jgi:FAD/FMN-containing dehydrogenase